MIHFIEQKKYLSKILSGSIMFYAFSGLAAVLNYVFYPVLGRIVSVGQYGEIQFLISTFTQLSVGFVILNILSIIISVKSHSDTEQSESIKTLNQVTIAIMLPITIVATVVLYLLHQTLELNEPLAILGLGISILVNIPYTTSIGKLQGNGQFMESGIVNILGAAGKLVFSVFLVFIGFGVTGAIIGVGIGTLAAYLVAVLLDKNRSQKPHKRLIFNKQHIKKISYIRNQAVVAIIIMSLLTILSIFDTIISRIFLDRDGAGHYAAIATTTKTILAATTPLMWLSLPAAVINDKSSTKRYIFLASIISILFCILMYLFNGPLVKLLTGIDAGIYLGYTVFASVTMSLCALAFLFGSTMVCRGTLRQALTSSFVGVVVALLAFVYMIPNDTIGAALAAQISCSLAIIIGGVISLK